jgi:nickel-dependent lactate racemase
MRMVIPYGEEKVDVEVEESKIAGIIEPNVVSVSNETKTIRKGIEQPIDSSSFDEFIADAGDLLFIVNDYTRPTPTVKILEVIYPRIKDKKPEFTVYRLKKNSGLSLVITTTY